MSDTQVWAERLREVREGRGLSRNDLAVMAGVTVTTIWRIEGGSIDPRPRSRRKLLDALGYRDENEFFSTRWQDRPWPLNGGTRTVPVSVSLSGPGTGKSQAIAHYIEDLREPGTPLLPIYQWAAAGNPLNMESAPDPVDRDYPPLGKERLIGQRGMAIYVKGTSMTKRNIREDDTVWVNPDRPPRIGRPVLARVWNPEYDGCNVIKVYRSSTELWCDGDEGPHAFVCQRFEVIGPVVWIVRGFPPS